MATYYMCVYILYQIFLEIVTIASSVPLISLKDVVESMNPRLDWKKLSVCEKLSVDPFCDVDRVVGDWIIVHSWNVTLQNKCIEVSVQYATEQITNRFMNDMYDHLESQPLWDTATLYLTMGVAEHELLLFADQSIAGSFVAIPNILKEASILPLRTYAVPLLKFHVKLISDGQYLIVADCKYGVSSLLARREDEVDRSQVEKIIKQLDIGPGQMTCEINLEQLKRQGYIL